MDGARSRRAEDMIPSAFAGVSTRMTIIIIRPAKIYGCRGIGKSKDLSFAIAISYLIYVDDK